MEEDDLKPIADVVTTDAINCNGLEERNWRKDSEWEKTGMTYAYISFPTTKEYGGMYNTFEEIRHYHDIQFLHSRALGLLQIGWRCLYQYYTDEMMDYIHNAIISYSKEFPDERIFQVILDEFKWK